MYTFMVIVYNEEKYIFQTLESIRYQIETYGKDRTYQIIIADDCSKDKSKEYIDYWLSLYSYLFEEVTRQYHDKNVGTCTNVAEAIKAIHGEYFVSTAGDDMFACTDVFTVLEQNQEIDVLTSAALILREDQIATEKSQYIDILAQSLYTSEYISWSVGLGCPIQAGAAWNKRLNTDTMLNYMMKLGLLDDRPRYYAIWKYEAPVKYQYINVPILVYRKNESSVTSFTGNHRSRLNDELRQFYVIVREESNRRLYKLCVSMQMHLAYFRGKGLVSYIRYLTPYYIVEEIKRLIHNKIIRSNFRALMSGYLEKNQIHVMNMRKEAERIQRLYENSKV